MFNRSVLFIFFIVVLLLTSCHAGKVPVSIPKSNGNEELYIEIYKNLAIMEMYRTGVPASITLAQGIIESDMGRSKLATEANNHFGIKCHDDWKGPTIRYSDDRRNECFRKYRKAEESYKDHSDFLKSEPRYRFLFSLDVTDYKGWAKGLKKAGYATNPDYANMLIRKIEEFQLYNLDKGKALTQNGLNNSDSISVVQDSMKDVSAEKKGPPANGNISLKAGTSRVMEKNRIQYIIVKKGDTHESLEKEFQLLKWELARYNELQPDFKLIPGQILYLQPKREKAEAGNDFHIFSQNETMYLISQMYGIKLKSLLNMNRISEGKEPVPGQKIWLRTVKPVE
jgi:LysM repeat protein